MDRRLSGETDPLGGGPRQYSIAFAKRGGVVAWHDVSRIYRGMAQEKAKALAVTDKIQFSLGYLDEAPNLLPDPYHLVFNRICWNYGFSDRSFAEVVYRLVRTDGYRYVDTTHSGFKREQFIHVVFVPNMVERYIGHQDRLSFPTPRGRLARLFLRNPMRRLVADYRSPSNDRILFEKPASDL